MASLERRIFKHGSTTYYWGAKFFPKEVRTDVLKLYSFLRVADDYVDAQPQQPAKFYALRAAWMIAKDNHGFDTMPRPSDTVDERVIKNIVALSRAHQFEDAWLEAFWESMAADLTGKRYRTLADSLAYTHGSAEMVGLMMARLMGLPPKSYAVAALEGRALQWMNFIRDAAEDMSLGRCYFPAEDLRAAGLPEFTRAAARAHPAAFARLIHLELARYHNWQAEADAGFTYLPGLVRPAVQTAADMYTWTGVQIAADPLVVLERKIKPSTRRIITRGMIHLLHSGQRRLTTSG